MIHGNDFIDNTAQGGTGGGVFVGDGWAVHDSTGAPVSDPSALNEFQGNGPDAVWMPPRLLLEHTLSPDYPAGLVVSLDRVEGNFIVYDESGCPTAHVHGQIGSITIDGTGPF